MAKEKIIRKTLFQRNHERVPMLFETFDNDFKDNIEVVDKGNIVVTKRVFAQDDRVDDYKVEVLKEINPSALNPSNYCTMSAGTPIDAAERVGAFMSNVSDSADIMTLQESYNSVSSVDDDKNNDKKVEE